MKQPIRFRSARESDTLDLVCLIDSASRGLALWLWTTLRQPGEAAIEVGRNRIRNRTDVPVHYKNWFVAEIDGTVAGGLAGRRLIPMPYERSNAIELVFAPLLELEAIAAGTWYLNVLAVYPEYRRQGVGTALLGKADEIARSTEASQVSIIVEEVNETAVELYRRVGFVEWARRPYLPYPGSPDTGDWILLKKDL
jgi:ribosomal protein S18 acetylase RimI-like enzyme